MPGVMGYKTNAALSRVITPMGRSRFTRRAFIAVLAASLTCAANAQFNYTVTVTNNSGAAQNDIHLLFINTGGTIANRVVLNPVGAPILSAGNEFNASFNALPNGQNFVGTFTAGFANVQFNSGYWTWNGVQTATIAPADVTVQLTPEPATYVPFGCGALGILLRRRKRQG